MPVATTQSHCNKCGSLTNHNVIGLEKRDFEDDHGTSSETYEMLSCRGCDSVSLRHTESAYGKPPSIDYYPPKTARRLPYWIHYPLLHELGVSEDPLLMPAEICMLMQEIYRAAEHHSARLVAMGIRAVIEYVMIDKVGDRKSFAQNVDAFQEAGYLSVRQRDHLEAILDAGHASIHRGWAPPDSVITTLLQITESIVEVSYLHDEPANRLLKQIPTRQQKPSRK